MRYTEWLDPSGLLLGTTFPLPLDLPFTAEQAGQAGLSRSLLDVLSRKGLLRRPLHGVYITTQAPDSLAIRVRTLSLVADGGTVITDRTAAWLHGVTILERGAHLVAPRVSAFKIDGNRVRRADIASGRRDMLDRDITSIGGVQVTTPLRTASDLGRLLWRYDALAALDGFLARGLSQPELIAEIPRYKGFRWVTQLRRLAPLADGRAESPGESALRLHWHEAGLPVPEVQWWVDCDDGTPRFRLDLALPELRYAAEYDGEEFHSDDTDRDHDEERRDWLAQRRHWSIEVFRKDIYSRTGDPGPRLRRGFEAARRSVSIWTPGTPDVLVTARRLPALRL